jgi:hypothetical protein
MSERSLRVRTRHAELSLEEIAAALPGTGEVMASVGRSFAMSWHAAHSGGWDLAAYFFRRTRSLLRGLSVTRPKYAEQLRAFDTGFMEPAYQALLAHDLAAFDAAFEDATERANAYHVETGHPYLRWRRPERPPDEGLDLSQGS